MTTGLIDDDVAGAEILVKEDCGERKNRCQPINRLLDDGVESLWESAQEKLKLVAVFIICLFLPDGTSRPLTFPRECKKAAESSASSPRWSSNTMGRLLPRDISYQRLTPGKVFRGVLGISMS